MLDTRRLAHGTYPRAWATVRHPAGLWLARRHGLWRSVNACGRVLEDLREALECRGIEDPIVQRLTDLFRTLAEGARQTRHFLDGLVHQSWFLGLERCPPATDLAVQVELFAAACDVLGPLLEGLRDSVDGEPLEPILFPYETRQLLWDLLQDLEAEPN